MKTAIVLGIGGMGAAACYHLARRGVRVTGLERFDLVHDRGSSHGETRAIRKAYFEHPDYVPLLERAYALWDELDAGSPTTLFHRSGVVMFGPQTSPVLEGVRRAASLHDITIESVDPHAFLDTLTPPEGFVGLREPDAGYLAVEACVAAHCAAARAAGARLVPRAVATGWDADEVGVTVHAAIDGVEEKLVADVLVLTPGAWAPDLLRWPALGLRARRVPLFWFPTTRPIAATFVFDLPDGVYYGFPTRDGVTKVAPHAPGAAVPDPTNLDRTLNVDELDAIRRFTSSCLPSLTSDLARHATCMYTMSPDEHFVIDHHPASSRVAVATGLSGHGYKFASVVGEVMAELVLDGGSRHPIGFLGAARLGRL